MLTQDTLRSQIEYDPETGLFSWLVVKGNRKRGWFSGAKTSNGYMTIKLFGSTEYAHRLAWLYMTGKNAHSVIDHIDRDKSNNKFVNLRQATKGENVMNAKTTRSDNTSGYTGVSWHSQRRKWQAKVYKDGTWFTKLCESKEEAIAFCKENAQKLFGEFAVV